MPIKRENPDQRGAVGALKKTQCANESTRRRASVTQGFTPFCHGLALAIRAAHAEQRLREPERSDYDAHVAAKSATGRENPSSNRRNSAPTFAGAFFVPVKRRYGGCAWAGLGPAGFLFDRFLTPRTVATHRVRTTGGDSNQIGVSPMAQHTRSASARSDIPPHQIATAAIGAKLIAFRVNRRPEQLAHLLGMTRMATVLGAITQEECQQFLVDLDALMAEEVRHG